MPRDAAYGHPFLDALGPVADAIGAQIVVGDDIASSDVPLVWNDVVVGGLRLGSGQGVLARLIEGVERDLGGRMAELSREDKQRAVRMLDERGAFEVRRSVEDVADALGVSRPTIYNYLNAIRPVPKRR